MNRVLPLAALLLSVFATVALGENPKSDRPVGSTMEANPLKGVPDGDYISGMSRLTAPGYSAPDYAFEKLATWIEKDRQAGGKFASKLDNAVETDEALMIYAWGAGVARDEVAVDPLIALHGRTRSDMVRWNCKSALSGIGGEKAGRFLLSTLDGEADSNRRFETLNLLGEMQYVPALPSMVDLLKKEPKQFYMQSMLAIGKMGDVAIPFLLSKLADPDRNVRLNAALVAGNWMVAPESLDPLRLRFREEVDEEIREVLLSSFGMLHRDIPSGKAFFETAASEAKDPNVAEAYRKAAAISTAVEGELDAFRVGKGGAPGDFEIARQKLYRSAGQVGDYAALARTSRLSDEPKLKRLRERILKRNSKEALGDYRDVTRIIVFNRWSETAKPQAPRP